MKSFQEFLTENRKAIKIKGYEDWKRKLPNSVSYIDSTKHTDKSIAYKKVSTPDGKQDYEAGVYYHKSGYGEIY